MIRIPDLRVSRSFVHSSLCLGADSVFTVSLNCAVLEPFCNLSTIDASLPII